MATSAVSGFGALLKRGDGAGPEVFTTIAEVFNISAYLGLDRDMLDATTTESTSEYEEAIPGIIRLPEVTAEVHFLPSTSGFTNLRTDLINGTLRNFKILSSENSATTWSFSGYVKSIAPSTPIDDKAVYTLTIKPSGAPTWS